MISTNVGMAQEVLPSSCIINAEVDKYIPSKKDLDETIKKVISLEIQSQIKKYDLLFFSL